MTKTQLVERIKTHLRDYARRFKSPVSVPAKNFRASLPQRIDLKHIDDEAWGSGKESITINLATARQILNINEQNVLHYRLMGYTITETARFMAMQPKTIEGYWTSIVRACKGAAYV